MLSFIANAFEKRKKGGGEEIAQGDRILRYLYRAPLDSGDSETPPQKLHNGK